MPLCLFDWKKTFDTINHGLLLSKLELYGFKGASINLFRDFLSDRTQVTVINNVNSETSFILQQLDHLDEAESFEHLKEFVLASSEETPKKAFWCP